LGIFCQRAPRYSCGGNEVEKGISVVKVAYAEEENQYLQRFQHQLPEVSEKNAAIPSQKIFSAIFVSQGFTAR
jgi:hypothetical protein